MKIGISAITALAILSFGKLKVLSYLIYTFTDKQKPKNNELRTFKIVGKGSLKSRAKAKGLIYGATPEADHQKFDRDLQLKSIFARECGLMVSTLHWDNIRPNINTFDFTKADYFAKFAASQKMLLRGHTLVWYNALPEWLPKTINSQNAEKILTNHIQTVVKRYAGKMHSWDVVNEPIELKDGKSTFRNNIWAQFLGKDYIDLSFRIAARSDPKALLVYNETDLEYSEVHQVKTLKLLEQLKSKGTPIHILGIQSHLLSYRDDFNPQKFRKFLKNVASLGLKIMITELDVIDKHLPLDPNKRDRIVAGIYEDYLTAALAEKAVIGVVSWGLTDRYTWVNDYIPREDRAPTRPLPFDRDYKPKLAWNAIARAFERAPRR
ncbi:endo-1,4-beta-xylanase [Chamaesiphon sp. VAR_48_metabat_135_sub]|uniref:endo-1,4-beta-xylanase n=1 Tax=Chamaesiphon sp. VAR_48_metabat_135_sub TaxID=2964699 RepID=UPI00286ADB0E|nr:endo-1,4-beta-xylanase [Chamaesiphon sp. VAR_48_metabat_135_sub]